MKKVKRKLMLVFLLGALGVSAQSTQKETINTSEKKSEVVIYKDMEYHIMDGIWYLKANKKFILRQAPKGARLKSLPKGGENVVMGGKKYYKLNGVFYKKIKTNLYEVARP